METDDLNKRFQSHTVDVSQSDDMDDIRAWAADMAYTIHDRVPNGREKSLAITKLEEVVFWANAGISRANA